MVVACFHYLSFFQHINAVCVHNGAQAVGNHYSDLFFLIGNMGEDTSNKLQGSRNKKQETSFTYYSSKSE